METKHTFKRWKLDEDNQAVISEDGEHIAMWATDCGQEIKPENLKLIAAAPDLLRELVQLRKWVCTLKDWSGGTSLDPDIESVDAAIKKATE